MHNDDGIQKKLIIDTIIVSGIIFLLLCPFFFFNLKQIPLGFLLGIVISIINHLILCLQSYVMINPNAGFGTVAVTITCYFTRFLLYGTGLFLAFYLSYFNINLFAWYSVFIGYMIIKLVILFKYGKNIKKNNDKNINSKV